MEFFGVKEGSDHTAAWLKTIRSSDVREPPAHIHAAFRRVDRFPAGLPLVMMMHSEQEKRDKCIVHLHGGCHVAGPQCVGLSHHFI